MASPTLAVNSAQGLRSFFGCFFGLGSHLLNFHISSFAARLSGFLEVVVKVIVKALLFELGVATFDPVALKIFVELVLAFNRISLLLLTGFATGLTTPLLSSAELGSSFSGFSSLVRLEVLLAFLLGSNLTLVVAHSRQNALLASVLVPFSLRLVSTLLLGAISLVFTFEVASSSIECFVNMGCNYLPLHIAVALIAALVVVSTVGTTTLLEASTS